MRNFWGLSLIIVLGLLLRIIFIDKPDGLWNDEYISWFIASKPFGAELFSGIKSQCHMPFYYLYLKFFMTLLGNSDLVLRFTSVLPGIISIIVMFYAGLEKNKAAAYYCAIITAVSSFLIYYSQEVRLYSVLFLFSALSLLYTLKCVKNPSKKNIILYAISNFLILFTHTIGFVFVFFNLIFLSKNLYNRFKKTVKIIWIVILALTLSGMPLIIHIFATKSFSQWWGHFSLSKIGFLFTDYFSPVLTNLTNAPDNFFYAPKLLYYMLIPAIIAIILIIFACFKEKLNSELFLMCACPVSVMIIAALTGKLVFITKYSIEIYPVLIYLVCFSLSGMNKKTAISIFSIYLLINLGYIVAAPYSAPKMRRGEGHKIVTDMISQMNPQKDDIIFLQYYPADRFEKYFDFSPYRVFALTKGNFPNYLSENSYEEVYRDGKELYRTIFLTGENKFYGNMLNKNIFNQLKKGQSVFVVTLNSVAFYSVEDIKLISENVTSYYKTPLLFLVFSYINEKTKEEMFKNLTPSLFGRKGNWTVIKFTKLNI